MFALFPQAGQLLRYAFANEFVCNVFLAILVFSCLDPTNSFVSIAGAPFVIGLGYFVIVAGFAVDSVSLNAGRDLGGRMGCAAIYGVRRSSFSDVLLFPLLDISLSLSSPSTPLTPSFLAGQMLHCQSRLHRHRLPHHLPSHPLRRSPPHPLPLRQP
jgi:hypothetical protein